MKNQLKLKLSPEVLKKPLKPRDKSKAMLRLEAIKSNVAAANQRVKWQAQTVKQMTTPKFNQKLAKRIVDDLYDRHYGSMIRAYQDEQMYGLPVGRF